MHGTRATLSHANNSGCYMHGFSVFLVLIVGLHTDMLVTFSQNLFLFPVVVLSSCLFSRILSQLVVVIIGLILSVDR